MCLVTLALDTSSRFPLVIATNRDEFTQRPTARLGWWDLPDHPPILGGRDLQAGGGWLGLTAHGRLGILTNVRDPRRDDANAPSRGEIVPRWLKGDVGMDRLYPELAMRGYNGFNLMALDFAQGECFWISNTARYPARLERGLYGLSNGTLNSPWPKVEKARDSLRKALASAKHTDDLSNALFAMLADDAPAPDAALPQTGVSLEMERMLSPVFVRSPDGRYGTRCSTLVITERVQKRLVTHVLERTYSAGTQLALLRRVTLNNWPPRYTSRTEQLNRLQQALTPAAQHSEGRFEASDVHEEDAHALRAIADAAPRKTRARNLLKGPRSR